jgi:hypothetical protein
VWSGEHGLALARKTAGIVEGVKAGFKAAERRRIAAGF